MQLALTLLLATSLTHAATLPADALVSSVPEISFYYCVAEEQLAAQMQVCKTRIQESLATLRGGTLTVLKTEDCASRRSLYFCENELGQSVQNGYMVTGKVQFIR